MIEIDAGQRVQNRLVKVTEFDIYRDEDQDADYLALTVQVPAEVDSSDVKNLFILDFSAYTTKDNPIGKFHLSVSLFRHCNIAIIILRLVSYNTEKTHTVTIWRC